MKSDTIRLGRCTLVFPGSGHDDWVRPHDCVLWVGMQMEPIMGAAYHTIHHTTYKHNYGHYFTYMDRIFGSLTEPGTAEAPGKKAQ